MKRTRLRDQTRGRVRFFSHGDVGGKAYRSGLGVFMIVSVGPRSLYFIPRQVMVLPKAEEMIKNSSIRDQSQEKKMSAVRANLISWRCCLSNFPIIFWRSIALAAWHSRNTMGTAMNRGRFGSPILAAYSAKPAVGHRHRTEYRLEANPKSQVEGLYTRVMMNCLRVNSKSFRQVVDW